jgi:PAS domain S-box-containing protein
MSIPRLAVAVAGKVPLRTVLIVPFVLQIVCTVGLVGYLSWRNGQQAVNDVASRYRSEISDRVQLYLKSYTATPHLINRINVDAVRLGQLNVQDLSQVERHLIFQLQQFDSVTGILFGSNRGDFLSSSRHTGKSTILVSEPLDTSKINVYRTDSFGNRGKLERTFRQPDARQRPWYKVGASSLKPTWTPIFKLGDRSDFSINATLPIYSQTNNELLGVFSSALNLRSFSSFLNSMQVGKSGKIFIIERNGLLIASSAQEKPFIVTPQKELKRLKTTESSNTLIRATSQYLIEQFGRDFSPIKSSKQLDFKINGKREFVQVVPFRDEFGLDWLIVVVVPESDFMEQINANNYTTLLLCVAAFIVSTGIGILTTRWITKPIGQLNTAAKKIARGEWNTAIELKRSDEVGQLAESFNQMAAQLQASFTALRESENRLTQFLEAVPVGVTVHDAAGKPTYANQTAKQIMGIDRLPDTRIARLAEDYHVYLSGTEQLYPIEKLPVVKALSGETSTVDDIELHRLERIVPLQVWATPIYDEMDKIVYAIVAFIDITQRKQSQRILDNYNRLLENQVAQRTAALRESETTLKAAQRVAHVGSWEFNVMTQKITWSEEQFRIFGLDPTQPEPTYEEHIQQIHPDDRASVQQSHEKLIATGKTNELDFRILRSNGEVRYVSGRGEAVVNEQGQVIKFFGTTMDITDRKLAEAALQESEERFREIAAIVSQFFFVRSASSGEYLYLSPAYETIWGRTCESLYQNPESWMEAVHPDDRKLIQCSLTEQFHGKPVKREYRIIRPDGQERWIAADISVVRDETGQPQRFVGLAEDITLRKLAEAALRESEQFLRTIYEGIEAAIFIVDVLDDGGFRYARINPAYERMSGIKSLQISGKTPEQLLTPDMAQQVSEHYRACLETGEIISYEERLVLEEKETYWITNLSPVRDSNERIYRLIGTSFNISDRKQAEEALRESQHFIQRVADASPNLWYIYDLIEQRNVYANREIAAILGYTPEEIQAMGEAILPTIIHPDDLTRYPVRVGQLQSASDDDILEIEYRIRDANGEWRTMLGRETVFARTPDGRVKQVLGTAMDITQLKQTQDLLESIFNEATDAIFLVNPETGLTVDCNQTAVELFEAKSKDELLNISGTTLQKTPFTQAKVNSILDEIERYGLWCQELEYVTKTGNLFWGNLAAKPIQVAGQKINLVRVTNISDVKQTEEKLQQAAYAADAANRTKSQFLANMSHELRTPLNAILGFSQLLNKSPNLTPENKENLKIVTRSGEHLLTLINQVLDLSKIEAGHITLNETNFDLFRLLDDLEMMFQLKANNKGLQLILNRSDDVPQYVKTDEVKLRQVLMNLLSNAIKFTKEGSVSLTLRRQKSGVRSQNLEASSQKSEEEINSPDSCLLSPDSFFLHCEIEDTGLGIAPEELESIFEAFVQAKTGKESREGTGLGLSISRKFVQLMGGQITVSSVVNQGSTFKFNIKVDVVKLEAIETQQSTCRVIALEPNQQRYRILIVDDKPDNRQLLIQLLSPLGFELREASNGREAIEVWKTWQPQLIFMDLQMPVLDGFEAINQMRKNQNSRITKIIALSAGTLEEKQTAALEAGCDDFIHKPFREATIFEMMSKHIGVRFVYEEPAVAVEMNQAETSTLNPNTLAVLPAEWLASLHQATFEGDLEQMLVLIEQIPDEQLANALMSLANNLQYKEILNLTQPRDTE